jgi:oxygen-independent coproporphyrinogen-3 oxidase
MNSVGKQPDPAVAGFPAERSRVGEFRSVYLHVPFCAHHCGYCDFTVIAGRDDLAGAYLQALELELESLETARDVDTIFVGGGTPTHLPPDQLAQLMELICKWFRPAGGYEFTVEANPCGLDAEKIAVLVDAGVNRVSLGVQSFDSHVLRTLEREHRRAGIVQTVERLRGRIENVSLDLIFGVPGQTLECWRQTLREAVGLAPQHISTYGLTFERGTAFWGRLQKGDFVRASEDLEREMYAASMNDLAAAGFEQYEISNFARPGYRCRHNEVYWKGLPYAAFGPGAARYLDGTREVNHRSVKTWLNRMLAGDTPVAERETLAPEERAREAIVIGLRRCDGIDKQFFRETTGFDIDDLAAGAIERHSLGGLLENSGTNLRLTRDGRFLADAVFVDFL